MVCTCSVKFSVSTSTWQNYLSWSWFYNIWQCQEVLKVLKFLTHTSMKINGLLYLSYFLLYWYYYGCYVIALYHIAVFTYILSYVIKTIKTQCKYENLFKCSQQSPTHSYAVKSAAVMKITYTDCLVWKQDRNHDMWPYYIARKQNAASYLQRLLADVVALNDRRAKRLTTDRSTSLPARQWK